MITRRQSRASSNRLELGERQVVCYYNHFVFFFFLFASEEVRADLFHSLKTVLCLRYRPEQIAAAAVLLAAKLLKTSHYKHILEHPEEPFCDEKLEVLEGEHVFQRFVFSVVCSESRKPLHRNLCTNIGSIRKLPWSNFIKEKRNFNNGSHTFFPITLLRSIAFNLISYC